MVLTDEQSQDSYPVASLESQALDKEKMYYRIPEGSVVNKASVPGYPQSDSYTTPNDYVQRLNGNSQKVGTSIVLKVMSGDKVNIRASSWYRQNGVPASSSSSAVADIVASLVQGIAGVPGGKMAVITQEQQQVLSSGVASFLRQQGNQNAGDATKPKSYLNWLLLDEQLKPVITSDGQNSGFEQVGADQQLTIHQVTQRPITKNGYLYIYLSNESPGVDVFFDNLQVTHIKGPLLEETHYYPFGLEMAGISSKAAGGLENRKRYNGIEFDNDFDLNTYEAFYRNLDPQLGRWWQIDPKCELSINLDFGEGSETILENLESMSPYVSMGNNPIKHSDPKGDIFGVDNLIGLVIGAAIDYSTQVAENLSEGRSFKESLTHVNGTKIVASAIVGFVTDGVANIAGKAFTKAGSALVSKLEPTVAKLAQRNIVKQVGKIETNAIGKIVEDFKGLPHAKMIKNIVKNASKDGVKLSDKKIAQLKRVVERSGGTIRTEIGATKNIKGVLHSQVEGYGTQTSSRHIIHANQ